MNERRTTAGAREGGFTLLEVLIAVVIFSIGLLGIASMQMTGMKQTFNSHVRAMAVAQAENMADRMRANREAVDDGDYDSATMPGSYPTDCDSAECTPAEMATFDLVQWNASNAAVLPGGSGAVCIDSTPNDGDPSDWACDASGSVYAVKVQWTERGLDETEAATSTQRFVMRVKPW